MMKLIHFLKKELGAQLPAFIFFFVSFNLINLTESLMFKSKGISAFSFTSIFFASLIVAKVLLVIDHTSFISPFNKKPLVYNIIWKTLIYGIFSFILRIIIRFSPYLLKTSNIQESWQAFSQTLAWAEFSAIGLWYLMLFLVFVVFRELFSVIGKRKIMEIFFGSSKFLKH